MTESRTSTHAGRADRPLRAFREYEHNWFGVGSDAAGAYVIEVWIANDLVRRLTLTSSTPERIYQAEFTDFGPQPTITAPD